MFLIYAKQDNAHFLCMSIYYITLSLVVTENVGMAIPIYILQELIPLLVLYNIAISIWRTAKQTIVPNYICYGWRHCFLTWISFLVSTSFTGVHSLDVICIFIVEIISMLVHNNGFSYICTCVTAYQTPFCCGLFFELGGSYG